MIEAISSITEDVRSMALNIAYCSIWDELMNEYSIDDDVIYLSLIEHILESLPHA